LNDLLGTWELKSLVDLVDGKKVERSYEIKGRLAYIEPNNMFVALSYIKDEGYDTNFYSGKFKILSEDMIQHEILISSDASRNGTNLERSFKFIDDNTLILRGKNISHKDVQLIWTRIDAD